MRMSELSQATGVSGPTLKYYLREGLLHAGVSPGPTRAAYDDTHVARVRLVRALVTGAGLSVAAAKRVIHQGQSMTLETSLQLKQRAFGELFATTDQREGMAAFLGKRAAQFTGK